MPPALTRPLFTCNILYNYNCVYILRIVCNITLLLHRYYYYDIVLACLTPATRGRGAEEGTTIPYGLACNDSDAKWLYVNIVAVAETSGKENKWTFLHERRRTDDNKQDSVWPYYNYQTESGKSHLIQLSTKYNVEVGHTCPLPHTHCTCTAHTHLPHHTHRTPHLPATRCTLFTTTLPCLVRPRPSAYRRVLPTRACLAPVT